MAARINVYGEPVCAILSRKTGKPVKNVMSRSEVLMGTGPTPGTHLRVKMGVTNEGKITAVEGSFAFEAGAYPGSAIGAGLMCAFAPYDIENGRMDGFDVVVNKPKSAAYRAPGAPQTEFAVECVVDEICDKLGIDPIEFRLKNAAKEGTRRIDGPVFPVLGAIECLEAAKAHDHYNAPLEGPNRGRGIAIGFWFNIGFASSCTISGQREWHGKPRPRGRATWPVRGRRYRLQAAEVLGIDVNEVHPKVGDTDEIGYTAVSGGSRVTYATGIAAIEAAQDVINQLKGRAALLLEGRRGRYRVRRGQVHIEVKPRRMPQLQAGRGEAEGDGRIRNRQRSGRSDRSRRSVRRSYSGRGGRSGDGQDRRGCATPRSRMPARRCIRAMSRGRCKGALPKGSGTR